MFDEGEPGKPKNWCWTIGVIVVISTINLTVFVVFRVLLDTEDDYGEPIVTGELRDTMTQFLGFFSLSFCFGCWCCFCCMGRCFRWAMCCFIAEQRERCEVCWSSCLQQKSRVWGRNRKTTTGTASVNAHESARNPLASFFARGDRVAHSTIDMDLEAGAPKFAKVNSQPSSLNSSPYTVNRGYKAGASSTEPVQLDVQTISEISPTSTTALVTPTAAEQSARDLAAMSPSRLRAATAPVERRRPTRLSSSDEDEVRSNDGDCWLELREPPSVPTILSENGLALRVEQLPDESSRRSSASAFIPLLATNSATSASRRPSGIGIANVDFMHVPVSLITPTSIAIVDPAYAADTAAVVKAAREADERRKQHLNRRRATVADINSPSDSEAPTLHSIGGNVSSDGRSDHLAYRPRPRFASTSPRVSTAPRMAEIRAASARRLSRQLTFATSRDSVIS